MTSNLPPGVTENMIPGNRPEDLKAEALYDKIYEALEKYNPDEEDTFDEAARAIFELCGAVYHEGYKQGQHDEAMGANLDLATVSSETDPDTTLYAERDGSGHIFAEGLTKEAAAKLVNDDRSWPEGYDAVFVDKEGKHWILTDDEWELYD